VAGTLGQFFALEYAISMRKKLVAGNWKMNGSTGSNEVLLGELAPADVSGASMAVFPPFPYLPQCAAQLAGSGVTLGAQDLSEFDSGAYTGEVSGQMLAELGCRLVLVGHSERRTLHGETNEQVARKAVAAHRAGLIPVVCVGETLAEREAGLTEAVVGAQVDAFTTVAGPAVLGVAVLAYEPVWAIGTGRTATPEQAQEVHAFIRARVATVDATRALALQILYGGSVKGANAATLFSMPDVDGGLVGGASLVAKEFLEIHRAASVSSR
jgi:triosephosphate isomerase (TIM)